MSPKTLSGNWTEWPDCKKWNTSKFIHKKTLRNFFFMISIVAHFLRKQPIIVFRRKQLLSHSLKLTSVCVECFTHRVWSGDMTICRFSLSLLFLRLYLSAFLCVFSGRANNWESQKVFDDLNWCIDFRFFPSSIFILALNTFRCNDFLCLFNAFILTFHRVHCGLRFFGFGWLFFSVLYSHRCMILIFNIQTGTI